MPGTRRYVTEKATVSIGPELEAAINQLVRDVAGDVIDAVEAIVSETAKVTRDKWYDNVKKRSGRSGDGTDYRLELRGSVIRGVVFNDAKQSAKQRINVDRYGMLLPGETEKSEQMRGTQEYYAYFVHRPNALSMQLKQTTLPEYRELMRYFRRTGQLPPGYRARSLTDRLGRKRPVGIAKLVRNPLASDGKRVWNLLVTQGHKAIVKEKALELDKALTASGRKLARR